MKKICLNVLSGLIISMIASNLIASDYNPYSVTIAKALEAKKLVVNLSDMQASNVKCTIANEEGRIVYSGKINMDTDVTNKQYDLSLLESGTYTMTIDDLMKVERLSFVITQNEVRFDEAESEIIFKPTVWVNPNKTVDFNLLAFGERVTVEIKNDFEVIHTEVIKEETSVNRVFNLENLDEGEYTMTISFNGHTFYRYITI